jgi:hypothetical protein
VQFLATWLVGFKLQYPARNKAKGALLRKVLVSMRRLARASPLLPILILYLQGMNSVASKVPLHCNTGKSSWKSISLLFPWK